MKKNKCYIHILRCFFSLHFLTKAIERIKNEYLANDRWLENKRQIFLKIILHICRLRLRNQMGVSIGYQKAS